MGRMMSSTRSPHTKCGSLFPWLLGRLLIQGLGEIQHGSSRSVMFVSGVFSFVVSGFLIRKKNGFFFFWMAELLMGCLLIQFQGHLGVGLVESEQRGGSDGQTDKFRVLPTEILDKPGKYPAQHLIAAG